MGGILKFEEIRVMLLDVVAGSWVVPVQAASFLASSIERHFFYKPNVYRMVFGEGDHGQEVFDISAFHDYCIDFGFDAVNQERIQAFHDFGVLVSSGNLMESFPVEAVEAEVDRGDANLTKFRDEVLGPGAIGGNVDAFYSGNFRQFRDEIHDSLSEKGFSTCDPDFFNSFLGS